MPARLIKGQYPGGNGRLMQGPSIGMGLVTLRRGDVLALSALALRPSSFGG